MHCHVVIMQVAPLKVLDLNIGHTRQGSRMGGHREGSR
jgi:hypothetical protein